MALEPAYQKLTAQLREVNTDFEIRGTRRNLSDRLEVSSHE